MIPINAFDLRTFDPPAADTPIESHH